MNTDKTMVGGGLILLMFACWHAAVAQTQGPQSPQVQPQAAPSQSPAPQATTNAVTGPHGFAPNTEVGTQQAAPSERPAPQATTSTREERKTGSQ